MWRRLPDLPAAQVEVDELRCSHSTLCGNLQHSTGVHVQEGFNKRVENEHTLAEDEKLFQHLMSGKPVPPLEVRVRDEGGVWVVEGHRRRRAYSRCRDAGKPIERIQIIQFTGNDVERIARIMNSNTQLPLSPYEQSLVVKELAGFNLSPDEIAALVGKSRATVDKLLAFSQANHDVQTLVREGSVAVTTLATLRSALLESLALSQRKHISRPRQDMSGHWKSSILAASVWEVVMPANNVTVNSYFCGAGLMDIGLMAAGIKVNQAFELDADACKTYRHNLGDHVKQCDISQELVFEQGASYGMVFTYGFDLTARFKGFGKENKWINTVLHGMRPAHFLVFPRRHLQHGYAQED